MWLTTSLLSRNRDNISTDPLEEDNMKTQSVFATSNFVSRRRSYYKIYRR